MDLRRRLIPDMICLRSFDSAARHRSFTRATAELHLTQSSVSRHVQDLEAQLGLSLFSRLRRQVVLTPAGAQFHREAERLLRAGEAMMLRAIHTGEGDGVLRISAPPTFASRWLVPRLPGFLATHPDIRLDLMSHADPFVLGDETCDLAFHFGEPVWPEGHCRYLCSESIIAVLGAGLAPVADLSAVMDPGLPLLQNSARPLLWQQWLEFNGHPRDDSLRGPRFDNFSSLIAAACAGMGLALLPDYLIEAELTQGRLVALPARALPSDQAHYMITPEEGSRSGLVSAFADWAAASVRRHP